MLNDAGIIGGEIAGEQVDVDGMAEKIARLRGERGVTVIGQGEFGLGETRRVRSPVVPGEEDLQPRRIGGRTERRVGGETGRGGVSGSVRSVRPSWGGKINPGQTNLFAEADERFKCGQ